MSIEQQFDLLESEIKGICNDDKILMVMIAELTKSFNIHAHGYIKVRVKNAQRFIHDLFRGNKIIGYICLKPVDDHQKWLDYIIKDIQKTTGTLYCRIPIIVDELSYIPDDILFQKSAA